MSLKGVLYQKIIMRSSNLKCHLTTSPLRNEFHDGCVFALGVIWPRNSGCLVGAKAAVACIPKAPPKPCLAVHPMADPSVRLFHKGRRRPGRDIRARAEVSSLTACEYRWKTILSIKRGGIQHQPQNLAGRRSSTAAPTTCDGPGISRPSKNRTTAWRLPPPIWLPPWSRPQVHVQSPA